MPDYNFLPEVAEAKIDGSREAAQKALDAVAAAYRNANAPPPVEPGTPAEAASKLAALRAEGRSLGGLAHALSETDGIHERIFRRHRHGSPPSYLVTATLLGPTPATHPCLRPPVYYY
jgi:hypothetical protein